MIEIPIGVKEYDDIVLFDREKILSIKEMSVVLYSQSLKFGIEGEIVQEEEQKYRVFFDTNTLKVGVYNLEVYITAPGDKSNLLKLIMKVEGFAKAVEVYATKK